MNKSGFVFSLMILFWSGSAFAQKSQNACVKSPPPGSAWSVAIERPNAAKKEPEAGADGAKEKSSLPVRLAVKAGRNGVTRGQILFSDGREEVYYIAQGLLLLRAPNSGKIVALPADAGDPLNLRVAGFPGVAWVARAWEKGREKKGNEEIVYYVCEEMSGDPPLPAMKLEAWIRKEDLSPVEAKIGGEVTYRYEKVAPFDEDISLPEAYLPVLAQLKKEQSVLDLIRKANAKTGKDK